MNTMVAFSTVCDMRSATSQAPAAEMPQKIPSYAASRRAICSAAAWLTFSTWSTRDLSKIFGR